jgi:hypothetical protein
LRRDVDQSCEVIVFIHQQRGAILPVRHYAMRRRDHFGAALRNHAAIGMFHARI